MRSPGTKSIPPPTLIFCVEPLPSRDQREPVLGAAQLEALRALVGIAARRTHRQEEAA
jgi:hypothetical protein